MKDKTAIIITAIICLAVVVIIRLFVNSKMSLLDRMENSEMCSLKEIKLGQSYELLGKPYELVDLSKETRTQKGVNNNEYTTVDYKVNLEFQRVD